MKRRCIVLIPFLFIISSSGYASSTDFEHFFPSPTAQGTFITESPELIYSLWEAGTYLQIERNPVLILPIGVSSEEKSALVHYRFQMRGLFTYNFFRLVGISIDFPVTLLTDLAGEPHQAYLNDMIIRAKFHIPLSLLDHSLNFGVSAFTTINTGDAEKLGGSDKRFMQPGIIFLAEYKRDKFFGRANIGVKEIDRTYFKGYETKFDDKLTYGLGIGYKWRFGLTPFLEYIGSSQLDKVFRQGKYDAQELYMGVNKCWKNFIFNGGGSFGLTKAVGIPSWRLVFGIFYQPGNACEERMVAEKKVEKVIEGKIYVGVVDKEGNPLDNAEVVITGRESKRGITKWGIAEFSLTEGDYQIRVNKEGYEGYQDMFKIKGGTTMEVKVELKIIEKEEKEEKNILPKVYFHIVDFETKEGVKEGMVYLPEKNINEHFKNGRWDVIVEPGIYRVVFTAEGYYPKNITITLELNEDKKFKIEMAKIKKEEKIVVTEEEIYIKDKINFETGSARILPSSFPILDAVVKVLKEHPEIKKILIKGHTDSVGSEQSNQILSEKRANAVREYLLKKGISADRIDAKGYGESQPIADNSTPEGKAMNRRVEFEIIERIKKEEGK